MKRGRAGFTIGSLLVAVLLGGCAAPVPPTGSDSSPLLRDVPTDQMVVRNTLTPNEVEVTFKVSDADGDTALVSATSSDQGVVADADLSPVCTARGRCTLSFTPNPERSASVVITLLAGDGRSDMHTPARSKADFSVHVTARLVTSAFDFGPGSLRQTVLDAASGDVIGFDEDSFAAPRTISLLGQIVLDKTLTIDGPGADLLTFDGNGVVRIFRVMDDADVVLRGLTLSRGYAPLESFPSLGGDTLLRIGGAALVTGGAQLTLENCIVTRSIATGPSGFGGGLGNVESTLTVGSGTLVTGNGAANAGGGIAAVGLGLAETDTTIEGSTIEGNGTFGGGGGIANVKSSLIVRRGSVVSGNLAGWGGGVYTSGTITLQGSLIETNRALDDGGGILNTGSAVVTGTAIRANTALRGGGLYNTGTLTLGTGAGVSDNTAQDSASGGGIYNLGTLSNKGAVTGNNPDQIAP